MSRCYNPSHKSFESYGGKGIRVCARWLNSFEAFLKDMGPKPYKSATIDREDGSSNYTPKNCRWSSKKKQSRNRKDNRRVTANGKTQLLIEWAEELGVPFYVLANRHRAGWDGSTIVNTPYSPQMDGVVARKIVRDYKTGNYTLKILATKYGLALSTVQAIISGRIHSKDTGLKYRPAAGRKPHVKLEKTPELLAKVKKWRAGGLSNRKIAVELGVSRTVVDGL